MVARPIGPEHRDRRMVGEPMCPRRHDAMDMNIDWRLPARGSCLERGLGTVPATALVGHVGGGRSGGDRS